MYGKRELKEGYHSDLRTRIPQEYWDDQELTLYATANTHKHWIHTGPEASNNKGIIGESREQYWEEA